MKTSFTIACCLTLGLLFGSCAKNEELQNPVATGIHLAAAEDVQQAKQDFLSGHYEAKISPQPEDSNDQNKAWTWIPLWDKAFKRKLESSTLLYVPLEPRLSVAPYTLVLVGAKRFLVVSKRDTKSEFSLATFLYKNSKENVRTDSELFVDNNFFSSYTGDVFMVNLRTDDHVLYVYKNGVSQKQTSNIESVNKKHDMNENQRDGICMDIYTCYWTGECEGFIFGHISAGVGGCGTAPDNRDNRCANGFINWRVTNMEIDRVCSDPNNPGPGDPGPGDPGPGDPGNPNNPLAPCPGDALSSYNLAPSSPGNYRGGTYGNTRNAGTKFHDGIDIAAVPGTPLVAAHEGVITAIRTSFAPGQYSKGSYGNYVEIRSIINGQTVYLKYNHLDDVALGLTVGTNVIQGSNIGTTGTTGNAASRGVIPHLHLQARDANQRRTDPQPHISTQFDPDTGVGQRPC